MEQPTTEKDLIQKAAHGETRAFGEIINKYQNLVFATALQITGDPVSAEDVSQDAFIAAFKALKDLRSENAFPSWLRKITRNIAFSRYKERKRIASLDEVGELLSPLDVPQIEMETVERPE